MKRRDSQAFTVVELLVVIAIIGLLVGLMIPAVNRARATARQTQCLNNQQQIGKAILAYATSKGRMPDYMSLRPQIDPNAPAEAYGWVHELLPFLGEQSAYDQIRSNADPLMAVSQQYYMPLLVCPSDIPVNQEYSWTNYAPNGGWDPNVRDSDEPINWPANGVAGRSVPLLNDTSIGTEPCKNSPDMISRGDGQSSTLLLAENVRLGLWSDATDEYRQAIYWIPDYENPTDESSFPDGDSDTPRPRAVANVDIEFEIATINPPANNSDPIQSATNSGINALHTLPSSRHAGGFVATFSDGSTSFLSDQLDYYILGRAMTSNGMQARAPGRPLGDLDKNALGITKPGPFWQSKRITDADLKP